MDPTLSLVASDIGKVAAQMGTRLGHVLTRFHIKDDLVWADDLLMAAFADASLTYEDVRFWQVGRDIAAKFTAETTAHVIAALDRLLQEKPELRSLVVEHAPLDPDERVERAERALQVLRRACSANGPNVVDQPAGPREPIGP